MTILYRYLAKQSLFLLFVILLAGTGIYAITDLFENLDHFLENDTGILIVALYIGLKIPNIISQILPAVFFVAIILQLNILERSNELTAIRAGGISPSIIIKFICTYGLCLTLAQLVFSQVIAVEGEQLATTIWKEEVRGNKINTVFEQIWFIEGKSFISIEEVDTKAHTGKDLAIYTLGSNANTIETIIHAKHFTYKKGHWELFNGSIAQPEKFEKDFFESHILPIQEDMTAIATIESTKKPGQLSVMELSTLIKRLKTIGSNVESLRVAWHGKFAYALSILIVGLYAMAISQATPNVYKGISSALLISFLYHSFTSVCTAMGETGSHSPILAGWLPIVINFLIVSLWLSWTRIQRIIGLKE